MARYWIQRAIKHPGRLTAIAKRAGAYKGGKISMAWLEEKASEGGAIGKMARLAITMRGFRRGKR